jgi:hypothetical protein
MPLVQTANACSTGQATSTVNRLAKGISPAELARPWSDRSSA